MAIVLSLETSTGVCSVALHEDGKLLAATTLHIAQSASSRLATMIDDLLKNTGLTAQRLDAVAITAGPGSYTGLRIGVATAKGICFTLNIPLLSLNTLELLTHQITTAAFFKDLLASDRNFWLCPMLDARRMEVYCLIADKNASVVEPTAARVIEAQSFSDWLSKGKVLFFGNGADKCREVLRHDNAIFVSDVIPSAEKLGEKIFEKFSAKQFEDLSSFEPFYLKDFVIKKPKAQI